MQGGVRWRSRTVAVALTRLATMSLALRLRDVSMPNDEEAAWQSDWQPTVQVAANATVGEEQGVVQAFRRGTPVAAAEPPASKARHAVVTLVASRSWAIGAYVLGCSLRKVAQDLKVDLLAMCFDLSDDEVAKIEAAGWQCFSPPVVRSPTHRWQWDFTLKLVPFNLTQYERVVVMDSDMLVLNPHHFDFLLSAPFPKDHIMAAPDCASQSLRQFKSQSSYMIQGGLIVLQPSLNLFQSSMSSLGMIHSQEPGGQGYISELFKGKVKWLPAMFNYVWASRCIASINRTSGYYDFQHSSRNNKFEQLAADDLAAGNVCVVHFHYIPKPWYCDPSAPTQCSHRWGAEGTIGVAAIYQLWLDVNNTCKAPPAGNVEMQRAGLVQVSH